MGQVLQVPYSLAKLVQSTVEPLSSIEQCSHSFLYGECLANENPLIDGLRDYPRVCCRRHIVAM
jgi:hypothetical protein